MAHESHPVVGHFDAGRGSLRSYVTGFILSIVLTIAAYALVVNHTLSGWTMIFALVGLAIIQLGVQLVFFLHMARESRPRWNFFVFLFMLMFVLIVVVGSLWIMDNLNYRMMTPSQANEYIQTEEGIHR